ncbi:MAG: TrbI/VirB10 family protein [Bdellovibrionales bacterium]|nr:TrbI/VirB10 family protein [Bdellovibrionales bacterium]
MNDNVKEVGIKQDKGITSIGFSKYFRQGEKPDSSSKKFFKVSTFIILALIVAVCVTSILEKNSRQIGRSSKELSAPNLTYEVPLVTPQILTHSDQINVLTNKRTERSALGKIKVMTLNHSQELPVGSEAKAILVSGATDGIVKAKLTQNMIVDNEPLLPENAILFGKGKSGEERLYIEFSKAILPTGESFPILAQGFDLSDKILGLKGAIVGSRAKKMGMAMGLGLLGGMADGMRDTSGSNLFMNQRPSLRDSALGGASKAALDQSQVYIEEMKKSPNIIQVKAGTEFVLIIDEPKKKDKKND